MKERTQQKSIETAIMSIETVIILNLKSCSPKFGAGSNCASACVLIAPFPKPAEPFAARRC